MAGSSLARVSRASAHLPCSRSASTILASLQGCVAATPAAGVPQLLSYSTRGLTAGCGAAKPGADAGDAGTAGAAGAAGRRSSDGRDATPPARRRQAIRPYQTPEAVILERRVTGAGSGLRIW